MRIWFNRGFSLNPIATEMVKACPSLEIMISTAPDAQLVSGITRLDENSSLTDAQYLKWVEEQVERHRIDVFIPTSRRRLVATADLPCRVEMASDIETLALLDDKHAFAQEMQGTPIHLPTSKVSSSKELRQKLSDFRESHGAWKQPCVKPNKGVFGHGFWRLTQGSPIAHIIDPDEREMETNIYLAALEAQEELQSLDPLVLMEYLPGPEVSFDVLASQGKTLRAVARTKLTPHRRRLQTSHPLREHVDRMIDRFSLHGVVNVQFRKDHDAHWKVLEINTRPAGGIIHGEQFGGGILSGWAQILSGEKKPEEIENTTVDVEVDIHTTLIRR